MKNINIFRRLLMSLVALSVLFFACNEEDHYKEDEQLISNTPLMELIHQNPDLSIFAEMLRISHYDKVLEGDQTYTVWAPNNAALQQVDLTDLTAVKYTVTNHIARYLHSTAEADRSGINYVFLHAINNKPMAFQWNPMGSGYLFGGVKLITTNLHAKNGLLHLLEGEVPFRLNVWQYLKTPELDSIADFLYAFDQRRFIAGQSTQIDVNKQGLPVYDSVFIESNEMFSPYSAKGGIGFINNEDSIYTMIVPTNTAWNEAYQRIYPYFKSNDKVNPDSVQDANTRYALVQNLVFRGYFSESTTWNATDTLRSTHSYYSSQQADILDPQHLFTDGTWHPVSNGRVFVTDRLNYQPWESWQPTVNWGATSSWGRTFSDGTIEYRSLSTTDEFGEPTNITFIVLAPTRTTAVYPVVSFDIAGTVAGKYNIYAEFVPASYVSKSVTDTVKSRIRYGIQQWDGVGKVTETASWKNLTSSEYVTPLNPVPNARVMDKLLLASNFSFPYANTNLKGVYGVQSSIRIKIQARATNAEVQSGAFSNVLRIRRIILEPVRE